MTAQTVADWQKSLKQFKEALAERLWALPQVSEAEKETLFKEYLRDLDLFEQSVQGFLDHSSQQQHQFSDENQLLRRLMGLQDDEVRNQNLALGLDLKEARDKINEHEQELQELRQRFAELEDENRHLRNHLKSQQDQAENFRVKELKKREDDIRYFSEENARLQNNLKDLETRIGNLRHLYAENNEKLVVEKQGEIAHLQKSLLDDMNAALHRKQQLMWAEEDMFAQGVAHRVRTALVSAQGQLYLTLERLGLLDPQSHNEAFWKARLNLLVRGAGELGSSFRQMTEQIQAITRSLDDYLHLTGRKELAHDKLDLKAMLRVLIDDIVGDRYPTLHVEFLSDDPLPLIEADRELINFILRALLQNSLEAVPNQTGLIAVHLKNLGPARGVQILVRDSGKGIAASLRERVFQPFFTTKEGRAGLSLSRAKRYADLHDGRLSLVESGPEGTLFQLDLPLMRGASWQA